jgi:hypothetical protein
VLRAGHEQPVVEVAASIEGGEAPHEQGATTEEYLGIFEGGATQRVGMDRRPNAGATFTTGC